MTRLFHVSDIHFGAEDRWMRDTQFSSSNGHTLQHTGWWLYDWQEMKTVQTFPKSEKEQAYGLCKLMNSIEEEGA